MFDALRKEVTDRYCLKAKMAKSEDALEFLRKDLRMILSALRMVERIIRKKNEQQIR